MPFRVCSFALFLLVAFSTTGCIRYYAGAPAPRYNSTAKAIDTTRSAIPHKKTNIFFPTEIDLFKRKTLKQYDADGYDVRGMYQREFLGRRSEVFVSVYPGLTENSFGGGAAYRNKQSNTFGFERQRMIGKLEAERPRVNFIGETQAPFLPESTHNTRLIYSKKEFGLDQPSRTTLAYLYLIDNWFLNIRYATSDLELTEAEFEADDFVRKFLSATP
ncbi:MAG: hypothetical protein ACFCU1_01370 [Sumerlaeia bacterium]